MRQLFGLIALPFLLAAAPPPPSPALTGQVVDGDGRPVAGAQVQAVALDSPRAGTEPPTKSRTGKDGRFRLGGFPAGTALALEASAEGFAPSIVRTSIEKIEKIEKKDKPGEQPRPRLRIVLGRGSTLTGRIVDPQGQPAGGAEVALSASFEGPDATEAMIRFSFGDPTQRTTADPKGRFRIERLAAGAFQLWADHPSFAPATQPRIKIPDKPAEIALGDIRLLAAAFLEGQVTDERGAPVAGASVTLRPTDGDFMAFHGGLPVEPVRTDVDGHFRSGRVAAGTRVNVSVQHPEYVDAHAPDVEVSAAEPLLVTLQPGRSLRGRVVDLSGKPVAGARLVRSVTSGFGSPWDGENARHALSDADGHFVLDGLAPGPVVLLVSANGFSGKMVPGLRIPETGEAPPIEIVLGQGATAEGRILDEHSRPVAGATVFASPVQRLQDDRGSSGENPTGDDGRYRIRELLPGPYELAVQALDGRSAQGRLEIAEGETNVQVPDLRLDAGFPVSGRVVGETGAPVAGAAITLSAAERPRLLQKTSAADGSFLFPDVTAGSWRLSARAEGFTETILPGELRVGEGPGSPVAGIELRLERGGTVTGQLLDVDPRDLSRVQISALRPEEGGEPRLFPRGSVDTAGRYRLTGLPPGTWRILALLPPSRQAEGTVQVAVGEESVLDLRLPKGVTLSGRLLLDGRPLSSATVILESSSVGEPVGGQVLSRHDGSFSFTGVLPGSYRLIMYSYLVFEARGVEVTGDQEELVEIASGAAEVAVFSSDGSPLAGARLQIERDIPVLPYSFPLPALLVTDGRGLLELPKLAAGTYLIHALHTEKESPPQRFQVPPGGTTVVQVVMP